MLGVITKKENDLLVLTKQKSSDLVHFQEKMKEKYSFVKVKAPIVPSKVLCKIDKQEADKLVKVVEEILVKRVPSVD